MRVTTKFGRIGMLPLTAAIGLLAGAIYACGAPLPGEEELSEDEPEQASSVTPEVANAAQHHEDEFQRKVASTLSPDEMAAVESELRARSIDPAEVTLAGRMVLIDDVYLDADTLLPTAGAVEKGRTYAGRNLNTSTDGKVIGPTQYSRKGGADTNGDGAADEFYEFHRPDTSWLILVVPDAAAGFLAQPFRTAVANVMKAADTCLTDSLIEVYTQSAYDSAPAVTKQLAKEIFVRYATLSQSCPGSPSDTAGCALYPREVTDNFGLGTETRVVPGIRIGVNSDRVSAGTYDTPKLVSLLTHEFLHALGLVHPTDSLATLGIPNTDCRTGVSSIMIKGGGGPLQPDDVLAIDKLYSPVSGGTCAYTNGFTRLGKARTDAECQTCESACTKMSASNIAGMCCQCAGQYRHFVKSTFSATTYLCQ